MLSLEMAGAGNGDLVCNGAGYIGGAAERRNVVAGVGTRRTLSMNGGAQIPAGGGEVSLWCLSQFGNAETVDYSQIMMTQVSGIF